MTYLVHGEPDAAEALRRAVQGMGWRVEVARDGETVTV